MKGISFVKRFSCSDNQYIILGLMELLRKKNLIGENNKFGGFGGKWRPESNRRGQDISIYNI